MISYRDRLESIAPRLIQEGSLSLPFDTDIYGIQGIAEHITADVLGEILNRGWIGASIINIWIRYLDYHHLLLLLLFVFEFFFP